MTSTSAGAVMELAAADGFRVVQRVILPVESDSDSLPLYVEAGEARAALAKTDLASLRDGTAAEARPARTEAVRAQDIRDRFSMGVRAGRRVSFGTYFNAFPASYWRRWTNVRSVRLTAEVEGTGNLTVYRSNAKGAQQRVESFHVEGREVVTVDLPLDRFGDGGWYWFDLIGGTDAIALEAAHWSVDADAAREGRTSLGITTFNRPDYCLENIRTIAESSDVRAVLDELIVVDQGNQRVRDEDGFDDVAAELGDQLRIVEQANIGGSGGFSRAMYETVTAGRSEYVILLDDDIVLEPESILRLVAFADFTRVPTLVGGHMFDMYNRSVLHTFGEIVEPWRIQPGVPHADMVNGHDFREGGLRSTRWLHRRVDVDYNGWWMCLIPTQVIREIGLALPVFIKWDDAEYGLRAAAQGIPTVSLPGAAVWHMPWTEKDDRLDWQAYYHQRNRWLVGLLYSPYRNGGALPRESFLADVKHLLTLQYSPVAMRVQALEDILSGPSHLHETLERRAAEMRGLHASYPDGQVLRDVAAYPPVARRKPWRKGRTPSAPTSVSKWLLRAGSSAARNYLKPSGQWDLPEDRVASDQVRWWRLGGLDAALVSTADGTGASVYRRDRAEFRRLLRRSRHLHLELLRRWDELAKEYRNALADVTSPSAWERTFGIAEQSHN